MSRTNSKTILVTGATSGIGRATALSLASQGHRVFASGRNQDALENLGDSANIASLHTIALDVTNQKSIDDARAEVERITDGYGVDVLINNAGYALAAPFELLTADDLRGQFETNVLGMVSVTQAFLPEMRQRGQGTIINISSLVGRMSVALQSVYCATKHAVEAMSDAMRQELAGFGIDVVLVEPGAIRTSFESTITSRIGTYNEPTAYDDALNRYAKATEKMYKSAPGPDPVTKTISRIIGAKRPKARYVTPWQNSLLLWAVGMLPTALFDYGVRWSFGLKRPFPTMRDR